MEDCPTDDHAAPAEDGVTYDFVNAAQRWECSWHPPSATAPTGTPHGASGICVTRDDRLVLISSDGATWTPPGGRPTAGESWRETLDREVREEACANVETARLVGFSRGRCVAGHEEGLILVRSLWVARVEILPWQPEFDTSRRKFLPGIEALKSVPGHSTPPQIYARWIDEALAHVGRI